MRNTRWELEHRTELVKLFNHFFPEELKKHIKRDLSKISQRCKVIQEFYRLVNEHLFCHECLWIDFEENEGYLPPSIYVHSHNRDWWDWEFSELALFEKAILTGGGLINEEEEIEGDTYLGHPVFSAATIKRLKTDKKPLCYLGDAIRLVGHCTNNGWLDFCNEDLHSGYCDLPTWNIQEVEFLAKEYRESEEIWSRVNKLEAWLKQKPARVDQVARMISRALKAKPDLNAQVNHPTPLVEILV